MAKMGDRKSPPGRGSRGSTFAGLREVSPDDVWTDEQRKLLKNAQENQAAREEHRKAGEVLLDDLCLVVDRMHATGMRFARIGALLRIGPSRIADMKVRAETVRALRALRPPAEDRP